MRVVVGWRSPWVIFFDSPKDYLFTKAIMKKLLLIYLPLVGLVGCGTSAVIKEVNDQPVQELSLAIAGNSKPIQLSKIVVRLKRGEHIGAEQGGLLCVPQADLTWRGGRMSLNSEEFTDAFKEELEKYSFKTVGDANALFEDPSTWKSEILVAGLIKELKANICFPFGIYYGPKGEAFVKVEWQIYSKLDRAVVHRVVTEGAFKATSTQNGGANAVVLNAFTQAARNLLADEKFRSIVVRGGEAVKETVFKAADGLVITPGKSKALTGRTDEWKDGVATVFAGGGHGSGFAISENLILTNHHVVGESGKVVVKIGAGFEVTGEVIAYNSAQDVAVVKLAASLPRHFRLQRNLPTVGADVFAVGSPVSEQLQASVTKGVVSGIRQDNGKTFIQSDVNVLSGSSGGPLLNSDGEAVGITVSGLRVNGATQGINFFVPIKDALEVMGLK